MKRTPNAKKTSLFSFFNKLFCCDSGPRKQSPETEKKQIKITHIQTHLITFDELRGSSSYVDCSKINITPSTKKSFDSQNNAESQDYAKLNVKMSHKHKETLKKLNENKSKKKNSSNQGSSKNDENLSSLQTPNSNYMKQAISCETPKTNVLKHNFLTDEKDHLKRTPKTKNKHQLLEEDLWGCPIETLFLLKDEERKLIWLAKIKIVEFESSKKLTKLAKKSMHCCSIHEADPFKCFEKVKSYENELILKAGGHKRKASWDLNCYSENEEFIHKNEMKNSFEKQIKMKKNIFMELYQTGMLFDFNQWNLISPNQCAKHTAKRVKGFSVVLDPFCGAGGNLVYVNQKLKKKLTMKKNKILNEIISIATQ